MGAGDRQAVWSPDDEAVERATLTAYRRWVSDRTGRQLDDYQSLWQWSVDELDDFWASIWEYYDVAAEAPYESVRGTRGMPGTQWFPGARLSYAAHIFRGRDNDSIALQHASESRELESWTWGRLKSETAGIAATLRSLGVEAGDVVAAYLPNVAETVAAFLACASIGAVWSSAAPEFGERAVLDRFSQIHPKVLLCVDGYRYNGKNFDRRDTVSHLLSELPSVQGAFTLCYLDDEVVPGTRPWTELVSAAAPEDLRFTDLPFEHPLWVLYSSGTTGLPKPIVHSQGGILMEHLKMMNLHMDAQPGDRIFWFTTTGWTMWNFLVGCLLTPASIVLYDGHPEHSGPRSLWDLAERAGVTCFGTSAGFLSACAKEDLNPARDHNLSALRAIGSTGSPLTPEAFDWVYRGVGEDIWLFSTSGGTDICSAFLAGVAVLPVRRGELQGPALGVAIAAWDVEGNELHGEVGELVVTEPMPSMPIFLWGDTTGDRLRSSYFDTYPGVWRHGDWLEITADGGAVIHGRSDSTINRGGIRMGTSEIYRALSDFKEIADSLVVDVPGPDRHGWISLFVVMSPGFELDDDLIRRIATSIRNYCSPRHVPNEVIAAPDVPRTLSGKLLEVPVKRILMGVDALTAVSADALSNPESLNFFVERANSSSHS